MVHDFYLTAAHVVFMDLPVVFDREIAKSAAGGPAYRWDEGYCARLGVVRRDDRGAPVRSSIPASCSTLSTATTPATGPCSTLWAPAHVQVLLPVS
jgi:hypothetical protein